jgi:hypothetical protein
VSHDYGKEFESSIFAQVNDNFCGTQLTKVNKLCVHLLNHKKNKKYIHDLKISYFWTSGSEFRFSMVDMKR